MDTILKEILSLPEVVGTCVIDKDLGIQMSALPDFFTEAMAMEANRHVGRMIQMAEMKGMGPQVISISFDKFMIIALSISKSFLLLILCNLGCNTSLVTTTANMLAPELKKILEHNIITIEYSPTDSTSKATEASLEQASRETAQTLEHIKQSLFETVGPVAEMVFGDCIEQWTETNPADISRISELVDHISMELNNPELAKEFNKKITPIL
ncbi:MAG: hypothetical protein KAR45_12820 [Desulfobacteraceae bacterium]|nr:hypothetical protein [Desulfobacteraceae bacterium]